MTVNELRNRAITLLSGISDNPDFEVEQLLQRCLEVTRNELLFIRSKEVSIDKCEAFTRLIERRISREPLQYILGEWEFFGLRMFCGSGCLIPRPETELIADYAIKMLPKGGKFLDLCTGSGCIPIAILNNRRDASAVAVDISKDAIVYALKNATYHTVSEKSLKFICADISDFQPRSKFDIIISNPPYIKSEDVSELSPEVKFEPHIALDGGKDGLDFYKIIATKYGKYLNDDGVVLLEIGYDIADEVVDVFETSGFITELVTDIFGIKRMCIARKKI